MTPKQQIRRQAVLTDAHHDYEKGMNVHAFFKVSNHAMGEDLVQETFVKTWAYLVRGGKIEVMRAFLYHILNNLIIDEYRRHKTVPLDVLMLKGFDPVSPHSGDLRSMLDGKATLLLISQLPPTYRKVMHMRHIQDLSLKEMSLITGQTRNALSVQLHRGLEKLKVLCNVA